MKKYTKKIEIINVFNEKVIIEPVEYSIAIKVIELMEEQSILLDSIGKLFVKLFDNNEDIQENKELKELQNKCNKLDEEEKALRKKYNYWYCGLNNLDLKDKEYLLSKYPRRNIKGE